MERIGKKMWEEGREEELMENEEGEGGIRRMDGRCGADWKRWGQFLWIKTHPTSTNYTPPPLSISPINPPIFLITIPFHGKTPHAPPDFCQDSHVFSTVYRNNLVSLACWIAGI